jgi:Flp pilus assembly protein TadD
MASAAPQAVPVRVALALAASLLALTAGGCLRKGPEITSSIGTGAQTPDGWRREAEALAPRNQANPGDAATALRYAAALRALDQTAQAVAVLEQAAVRSPKNLELLSAYGKALGETGRYKEASEVLARAHLPRRPDWRVLSAQGAVADQMGDHGAAQRLYETALKIRPGEPSVLSNSACPSRWPSVCRRRRRP